jgi:two-component system, OmpR family, sensor histidine kinase VicK
MKTMGEKKYSLSIVKDIGKIASDGVLAYNLKTDTIDYCNPAIQKMLGVKRNEIIGKKIIDLKRYVIEDPDFFDIYVRKLMSAKHISNIEFRVSDVRYVSCDAYYLADKEIVIVLLKDITNSKQYVSYITEFGARKDAILDMVAHNLSGPLNVTNNLLSAVDQLSEAQHYHKIDNYTRLIRENTQQCIEVINSFLIEEHLASKEIFVKRNRYDVLEKIRIVIERMKPFNPDKIIKLKSNVPNLFVTGDDVKFFQIIHNLLSNSAKFTRPNDRILIDVADDKASFYTRIQDTGIGVPEYLQPYIFKKNTPASRPGLKGEKSIGMGLYTVKELVQLMKGNISFESREGEGTVFTLEFPKQA